MEEPAVGSSAAQSRPAKPTINVVMKILATHIHLIAYLEPSLAATSDYESFVSGCLLSAFFRRQLLVVRVDHLAKSLHAQHAGYLFPRCW